EQRSLAPSRSMGTGDSLAGGLRGAADIPAAGTPARGGAAVADPACGHTRLDRGDRARRSGTVCAGCAPNWRLGPRKPGRDRRGALALELLARPPGTDRPDLAGERLAA